MRRLLFLSKHYATDFGQRVEGVYQRMRLLLEAAATVADSIDILFFVDREVVQDIGPSGAQESLLRAWGIKANVYLIERAVKSVGPVRHLASSMVDFRENEEFFRYTGPKQLQAIRAAVRADTDLIFAHRIYTAAAALKVMGAEVPIVTDLDDIEHRTRARMWRAPPFDLGNWLRFLEYPNLRKGEVATIEKCKDTFVCSSQDKAYLAGLGATRTSVIPNAVRFPFREPKGTSSSTDALFFIGSYSYPPNRQAATELIEDIFPLVRARRPSARLIIVGEGVESLRAFALQPVQVEFLGYVADLAGVYRQASVACCPIRVGGGTRIKIIEAIAYRLPVVSTSVGAEGLELEDGKEILLRDTASSFADACVQLLDDRVNASIMAEAAYSRATRLYDREAVIKLVAQRLGGAAAKTASIVASH